MSTSKIDAMRRLEEYDIKLSLHRIAIIEYLINNPTHPTADMIFSDLFPAIPTLSKTTVYNTLKLLEDSGAVRSIYIDDKSVRYDANLGIHGHFRCKSCGDIHDLNIEGLDSLLIKGNHKLSINECQIYYKGYCGKCNNTLTRLRIFNLKKIRKWKKKEVSKEQEQNKIS